MKLSLFPILAFLFFSISASAQTYSLEVEVVTEDVGVLVGALGVTDLTGYSCTRLYVNMENTDDFLSSVSGDAVNPTFVNTTTSFYHSLLGAATPNGINSLLFGVYPDLAFDSWVTIGLEGSPDAAAGEAAVSTVQSTTNPWVTNFDLGGGLPGGNITIDDAIGGAWYALNGDANGVAGDELKVLLGQFTTDGDLSGQLYCQVFINGEGANEYRETFFIGGAPGCTDETACNFDAAATGDDGSCTYPSADNLDCDGNCLNDADGDGTCDEDEVPGCTDATACNFDAAATDDDASCTFPATDNLDCDGNCLNDADGDGTCDEDEVAGCTDATACNFDAAATDDDASCTFPAADNLDCDGNCLNDADGDGTCDEDEVAGCTDATACNFDAAATDDDASCTFPAADNLDCDGNCLNDADGDGTCDEDEVAGCTDATACNFDAAATDDDGSCTFPAADNLDCDGNCLNDADGDGTCDEDEVAGCTDATACNFDAAATDDDASCTFPAADNLDCDGNCLNDADGDGTCDEDEISGCTDAAASNYDETATEDDGSCAFSCSPNWGEPVTLPSVATVLAHITVGGENAAMDDQVGAFVNDELRGVGNIIEYEGGTYVNMTVYLAGGEETVSFALFNADDCTECPLDGELTVMGFGEYGSFDDPVMFDANCNAGVLEVSLTAGWNYVSTNLIPEDYSIASMFDDALEGNLLKVLGDDDFALGQSYTPGIPSVFNSLQMHSDAAGYVIKVEEDAVWTSTGDALDAANTPLDLNEGWNIIGYVPQTVMAVEEALSSIDGNVGTVIDGQNGTVWNPANPNEFNNLLDLEPGRSYWIRMLEAATLTYPEAAELDSIGMGVVEWRTENATEAITGWSVVRAPGAAAVAAEVLLDDAPVQGEAYIGAFIGDECVAARAVMPLDGASVAQMAIMVSGLSDVHFRLWVDGTVIESEDVMTMEGGDEWGQGGAILPILRFTSETNAIAEKKGTIQFTIAPIPARLETWINLELNCEDRIRISVYDARGAEVAVIRNGAMAAGTHRVHLDLQGWAAGTYFVNGQGAHGSFRAPLVVH